MKNYENMSTLEQEHFVAHAGVELVQRMYHEKDKKGLEVLVKNLDMVIKHAKDCIDCIEILNKKGDTFNKIFLLIDYLGQQGISESFLTNLEELQEKAHDFYFDEDLTEPTYEEREKACANIRAIMDRNMQLFENEMA